MNYRFSADLKVDDKPAVEEPETCNFYYPSEEQVAEAADEPETSSFHYPLEESTPVVDASEEGPEGESGEESVAESEAESEEESEGESEHETDREGTGQLASCEEEEALGTSPGQIDQPEENSREVAYAADHIAHSQG